MKATEFNINNAIYVRLTPAGLRYHKEAYDEFQRRYRVPSLEYHPPRMVEGYSLRGLIWVGEEGGQIIARDGVSWDEEAQGLLRTVWQDSTFRRQEDIRDIRARLRAARP